jgi:hypothetical protein
MRMQGRMLAGRLPRRMCILIAASAALAVAGIGPTLGTASADTPAHTDVLFLFDTSGSMGSELSEAKEKVSGVMESVSAHLPDVAFGVANVEDIPGYENGTFNETLSEQQYAENKEKAWRLDQPITTEREKVLSSIGALTIGFGGDGPEAYSRALWESDTNPTVGWRASARHEIVLIADEVPHDVNLNEGLPESEWLENPFDTSEEPGGKFGIPGTVWTPGTNLRIQNVTSELGSDGKPLESIEFLGSSDRELPYWEYWAALSGGQALDGSSGELATTLTGIIETGATKALSGCPAGQVRVAEEACIVPPKPTSHPTVSQVICNLVVATASDTCTATVGDAAPSGATNPTGTVSFASSNGGVFSSGNVCTLVKTPLSGNVSSCSVQFLPPAKPSALPAIAVTYSGDATHNSSTAQTHYGAASELAEDVDLSEAGTVKPDGEVEIPIDCGFPCESLGELLSGPDLGTIASVSPVISSEALASSAATHGKKKNKKKKAPVLLGKGKLKLSKAGKGKLILKPTAKGKHALGKLKGKAAVHLTLKVTIRTLNGTTIVSKKQHVTLHAAKAKKKGHSGK